MIKFGRLLSKAKVVCKKNSPEILLVIGIGTGIATVVTACRSTLRAQKVLEDHDIFMSQVHRAAKEGEIGALDYTSEDKKKDTIIVYTKTGVELAKAYAIPVTLGAISIASTLGSFGIMKKRYLGAVALYTTLDNFVKKYRGRVIDKFGAEVDRELAGITTTKIVSGKIGEDGVQEVVEEEVRTFDPNGVSPYSRIFYGSEDADKFGGKGNPNFVTNYPESNKMYLTQKQNYWNEKLKLRARKDPKTGKLTGGWVFLNEILIDMDLDPSRAGQDVGWIYDEVNPIGDNYIDFGMYRDDIQSWNFINGKEDAILLDFNCDGYILDKVKLRNF